MRRPSPEKRSPRKVEIDPIKKTRFAYLIANLFGPTDKCSGSECLSELIFTMPFTASVMYSSVRTSRYGVSLRHKDNVRERLWVLRLRRVNCKQVLRRPIETAGITRTWPTDCGSEKLQKML